MNKTRVKNIINRWKGQATDFSPIIAASDMISSTVLRHSNGRLKHNLNEFYYNKAKKIIYNRYHHVVDKWNFELDISVLSNFNTELPIYIFWWQSLDNAPGLIRFAVKEIKERAVNPVVVIDKNNWKSFVELPDYAVRGVSDGSLSITAFSDILRYNLLAQSGGMWIDPTCYLSENFSDDIYQYPFYTINHQDAWEHPICMGKWSTFFLCCGENNPLFGYLADMINHYWKNEKSLAVYLLPDVFFSIGYDHIRYIKKIIDNVPINNVSRVKLISSLVNNHGRDFDRLLNDIQDGTYIHKLTYKTYIAKFDGEHK